MKKLRLTFLILLNLTVLPHVFCQNVSINATGSSPDNSAMLDVSSSDKGFLMPRMTTIDRDGISLPATGLAIFNTTTNGVEVNTGTSLSPVWSSLAAPGMAHTIYAPATGNSISLINNQYNIVDPSGSLAALTVTLPSLPLNNDVVYVKYTKDITAVTYNGGTVSGAITSPAAGQLIVLVFDSATSTWY